MTRLIVVRHGESTGNERKEFHGNYNSDITERGRKQAEATAEYLDKYKIDKIYSSTIKRAHSTAECTAKRQGLEVIECAGLREIQAGKWERMFVDDIMKTFPEEFNIWRNDIYNSKCTDGESVKELAERIIPTFESIVKENDGKTVGVFTHATPIRIMHCVWNNMNLSEMKNISFDLNASVSVIDCYEDGHYEIIEDAEAGHLEKAGLCTGLAAKFKG